MNKTKSNLTIITSGSLVIMLTLAIFFLSNPNVQKTSADNIGLLFILLSQVFLFIQLFITSASRDKTTLIQHIKTLVLAVYMVVTCVFSMMTSAYFFENDKVSSFVVSHIGILIFTIILTSLLSLASYHHNEARKNQFKSEAVIKECEHQLQLLALEFPHYEGQIDSVLEELKYSEKTMCVEEDKQLLKETKFLHMLLSEENEEAISKQIKAILFLIKKRNLSIKNKHVGGL